MFENFPNILATPPQSFKRAPLPCPLPARPSQIEGEKVTTPSPELPLPAGKCPLGLHFLEYNWIVREMVRAAQMLVAASLCSFSVGCVPILKKHIVHYGVQGKLTDVATGLSIGKTNASIVVDRREFNRKTNHGGEFKVPPETHYFWTWLGGPWRMDATNAVIEISLHGYEPYGWTFTVRSPSSEVPVPPDKDWLCGSYIVLGDVEMKKRGPNFANPRP